MLPAAHLALFGRPAVHRDQIPFGGSVRIPPNKDRYCLIFWGNTVPLLVYPDSQGGETFDPATLPANSVPVSLSHLLVGAVTTMGFRVATGAGAGNFTWIEAFMADPGSPVPARPRPPFPDQPRRENRRSTRLLSPRDINPDL